MPDSPTDSPLDSPSAPDTPDAFDESADDNPFSPPAPAPAPSAPTTAALPTMNPSSHPLGPTNAARRPPAPVSRGTATAMNPNSDIAAKLRAFTLSRQNTPAAGVPTRASIAPVNPPASAASQFRLAPQLNRSSMPQTVSAPVIPVAAPGGMKIGGGKGMSMAERRGLKLPGGLPPPANTAAPAGRKKPPGMTLSQIGGDTNGAAPADAQPKKEQSAMEKYAEYIDTKNGALIFKGKATVNADGIEFSSGRTFSISLDEVDTMDELGKGNYGTVYKVRHARPKFRRTGQGLGGNKPIRPADEAEAQPASPTTADKPAHGTTGKVMAMKEMRLELDDAKFQSIIMELDILHRCTSAYIVDFYGAFFQEGAVYICMEWMDGGSLDKIYGDGIPENVLRKVAVSAVLGLKSLKEEHNIIHRDVKPTNILCNTRGQVKICDFGVSGNLVASIAKTNIGCQSYMAPERISSGGPASGMGGGTYSVQSDIWSLGLTIIECALGRYPYPPETYDNIFSQLSAIVDGTPPDLPPDNFSDAARNFVAGCLNKIPKLRPTYPMLLQHAWIAPLVKPETIVEADEEAAELAAAKGEDVVSEEIEVGGEGGFVDREVGEWVAQALEDRKRGKSKVSVKPALHSAALDAGVAQGSPIVV